VVTAVDTSVLLDVFGADPEFGARSADALRESIAEDSSERIGPESPESKHVPRRPPTVSGPAPLATNQRSWSSQASQTTSFEPRLPFAAHSDGRPPMRAGPAADK